MPRKKLFQHLVTPFVVIMLAIMALLNAYIANSFRAFYHDRLALDLEARAELLQDDVVRLLQASQYDELDRLIKRLGPASGTRFTVILPLGRVAADSSEDPARMDNHAERPEIAAALRGGVGRSLRFSATLHENMMYLGVPLRDGDNIVGVLRGALPATAIEDALHRILLRVSLGVAAAGILAIGLTLGMTRRVAKPLRELRVAAESFAHGDFNRRVPPQDIEEIGELADSMNWMAVRLDEEMQTIQRQANEQEAVLASMIEGVLAVDAEERVIRINRAAASFLHTTPADAAGRTIQEIIRNPDLEQFVRRALISAEPIAADLAVRNGQDLFLEAHGTVLRGAQGGAIGALIVLYDVTRLRRLENVRRDFVANVSHELKTPVTTIKGFVETLLDGAIEDAPSARRFLEIIAKQADRLANIITDLLNLSRVEQESERGQIGTEDVVLQAVLESAAQVCRPKAEPKNVALRVDCPQDLRARVNPELLEQAVINLLDNAVKHSENGRAIQVEAAATDAGLAIRVRDEGCGIAKEHLPRLFERFYRVDKARSRTLGGTGLGLAIVKHIAQAHGGSVSVESEPGKGSTFTIHLPRR